MPRPLLLTSAAACAFLWLAPEVQAAEVEVEVEVEAVAEDQTTTQLSEVIVMGKRVIRDSASATGLDLTLRQTPQSVTVVNEAHIKQFNLQEVNQLLPTLPGIQVESAETDRTYYNSRGFDIVNFQVDGVGQPLYWGSQTGALDLAGYERIEAVRGANGLLTGTGNPSATINYIRKRPTEDFRLAGSASYGTWDSYRLTGDVSGPINQDGTVRGRLVYANTQNGSHLDYYETNRHLFYGILTWDITPKLNATAGYSRQENRADGVSWGALPLRYTNGQAIDYDRSDTAGAPWTYWDTLQEYAFGEVSYAFDNGWSIKGIYTHRIANDEARLLYATGEPDALTGLGVVGTGGYFPKDSTEDMVDIIANGRYSLFGREHQLVLGYNTAKVRIDSWDGRAGAMVYGPFGRGQIIPPALPVFSPTVQAEQVRERNNRLYAATHLNLSDRLTAVVGVNAIESRRSGYSYGVDQGRSDRAVSPYVGLVYDLNQNLSLYGSYSDLYLPQLEADLDRNRLDPAKGSSWEFGIKSEWFDRRLYATAAIFQSKQTNLAEFAGVRPDTVENYYRGVDTEARGFELEVSGRLTPQWTVAGGYTHLSIEDDRGQDTRRFIPRDSLKLNTTYSLPRYSNLIVGGAVRWQSPVYNALPVPFKQESYAVVDLLAGVDLTSTVRATLNAKNVFDKTYFASMIWPQANYAAPRSLMVTLDYRF